MSGLEVTMGGGAKAHSHHSLMPPSQDLAPLRRLSQQSDPPKFESQTGTAKRNEAQANKRKELDGHRCILTKQQFPHACHIVGYAANNTEESRASLDQWLPMAVQFFFTENLGQISSDVRHIFSSSVGASDRKWNMLSLNPTLHDWWSRGCFGLKWIGLAATPRSADPEEIQTVLLQFEWLMWRARPVGAKRPAGELGRTEEEIKAAFP